MSLLKDLVVISNSYEELRKASLIDDGIKEVTEIIKYALDEEELKLLLEKLNPVEEKQISN